MENTCYFIWTCLYSKRTLLPTLKENSSYKKMQNIFNFRIMSEMCKLSIIYVWSNEKKYKTIQTLLKSNRKNSRNRGQFYIHLNDCLLYIHLHDCLLYIHLHDCSLSWIGQVTSTEIDDVKLVLCSQASPLSEMMRSCKCFLRQ